jgi:undecaprenyl pyrophosphate phosphatase UppP
MEEMSLPQAVWIGAAQILSAIFPDLRSMCTIVAGQRHVAPGRAGVFVLSVDAPMFVATGYDFVKTVIPRHQVELAPLTMNGHEWIVLAIDL